MLNVLWSNATEEIKGTGCQEESTDWLHQSTYLHLKDADPSTVRSIDIVIWSWLISFVEAAFSHPLEWGDLSLNLCSLEINPSLLSHCWLGNRKGMRPVRSTAVTVYRTLLWWTALTLRNYKMGQLSKHCVLEYVCILLVMVRAVWIELFTTRVLCRVSYRVLEYSAG